MKKTGRAKMSGLFFRIRHLPAANGDGKISENTLLFRLPLDGVTIFGYDYILMCFDYCRMSAR